MENHKGKSPANPFSNNEKVIKIDLTLKLGLSINEKQKVEEENKDVSSNSRLHGFPSVVDQPSNYDQVDMMSMQFGQAGTGRLEQNSSSSATTYQGCTNDQFMLYQGRSPPGYNVVATNNNTTPRKRSHSNSNNNEVASSKICKTCGANTTPLWRKGPDGPQTLCNACGLRHLRTVKKSGE